MFTEFSIAACRAWLATHTTNDGEFIFVNGSDLVIWNDECVASTIEPRDFLASTWSLGLLESGIAIPTLCTCALYEVANAVTEISTHD